MIIIASPNEQIPEQMAQMASAVLVLQSDGSLRNYAPSLPSHKTSAPSQKNAIRKVADDLVRTDTYRDFRSFWQRKPLQGQTSAPVRHAPSVHQPQQYMDDVETPVVVTSSLRDTEAAILNMSSHTLGAKHDRAANPNT